MILIFGVCLYLVAYIVNENSLHNNLYAINQAV
jgi:hypothetical protein